jgi:hypothetical protein
MRKKQWLYGCSNCGRHQNWFARNCVKLSITYQTNATTTVMHDNLCHNIREQTCRKLQRWRNHFQILPTDIQCFYCPNARSKCRHEWSGETRERSKIGMKFRPAKTMQGSIEYAQNESVSPQFQWPSTFGCRFRIGKSGSCSLHYRNIENKRRC